MRAAAHGPPPGAHGPPGARAAGDALRDGARAPPGAHMRSEAPPFVPLCRWHRAALQQLSCWIGQMVDPAGSLHVDWHEHDGHPWHGARYAWLDGHPWHEHGGHPWH
eukprot:9224420-Alexandrium_andersonii.AAC.1